MLSKNQSIALAEMFVKRYREAKQPVVERLGNKGEAEMIVRSLKHYRESNDLLRDAKLHIGRAHLSRGYVVWLATEEDLLKGGAVVMTQGEMENMLTALEIVKDEPNDVKLHVLNSHMSNAKSMKDRS